MAKRGRPPRPPRTDSDEIKKAREILDQDIERRLAATFGPIPAPWISPSKRPGEEKIAAANSRLLDRYAKRSALMERASDVLSPPPRETGMQYEFVGVVPTSFDGATPPRDILVENSGNGIPPGTTPLVSALRRACARVGTEDEIRTLLRQPFGWMTAVAVAVLAEEDIKGLFAAPTDEQLAAAVEKRRAQPNVQAAEEPKQRRRRKRPDFNAQAKRILPTVSPSIRQAAFDSILFLFDEAPESMRPKIEDVKPELVKVRDLLTSPDLPPRLAKMASAAWDLVRCAAWAEGDIRDSGPNGAKPALIHYTKVMQRMKAFAANCPTGEDGRVKIPRDVALRLLVPAFNATHSDRRRCIECGTVFALRNDRERMTSKYCGAGNKRCANRVSSRAAKAAKRQAGDVLKKMRSRDQGDAAVERAERQRALADPYDPEDILIDLIDAARKSSDVK